MGCLMSSLMLSLSIICDSVFFLRCRTERKCVIALICSCNLTMEVILTLEAELNGG